MKKRKEIKRSVVAATLLVGLIATPPQANAGFFGDIWKGIKHGINEVKETVESVVDNVVDTAQDAVEDSVIFLLKNGAGKGADYLIGLMLKLDKLNLANGPILNLMIELIENDNIITDDIFMEMMYNKNMVSMIDHIIEGKNSRAERFFRASSERMMPIMMKEGFSVDVNKLPSKLITLFSDLRSTESTTDGLEKVWEELLKSAMSNTQSANAMFGILMGLAPEHQHAMMEFMFLAKTADGQYHTAESVNFNQAMIEGFAVAMQDDPQGAMALFQQLMPLLATFDAQGNMTGMTPFGQRFFTVLGTKAQTCDDPSALALMEGLGTMMPQGTVLPVVTNDEACGRVEDPDAVALINSGQVTYQDSDGDGVPDFMDHYPDVDNNADMDGDGIPDTADDDMDGDGITNDADADVNGDGIVDNGADTDGDGVNNANDNDIDGDGVDNDQDSDMDGDGIENDIDSDVDGDGTVDNGTDADRDGIIDDADVDVDGDGTADNGTDTDGDGVNNAYDNDIDGDGVTNDQDSDVDGDGVANDADVDVDGDGNADNGADTDGDGINDDADSDVNGDGTIDNGPDDNHNGINDTYENNGSGNNGSGNNGSGNKGTGTPTNVVLYFYNEKGELLDQHFNPVQSVNYPDGENTFITFVLPEGRRIVVEVPIDLLFIDDQGNRFIISDDLDGQGSKFMMSMTKDGFGKAFMGNDQQGFEMSGNLAGMKPGEELVFSAIKDQNGRIVGGRTRIKPKDKALSFDSSVLQ